MLHDLAIGGIIAVGIYYLQGIFDDIIWLVLGFLGAVLFYGRYQVYLVLIVLGERLHE